MGAKLNVAPEAEQDISDAYVWYECHRTGLGEEFLSCVDACIQLICRMPEMYAKVPRRLHMARERHRANGPRKTTRRSVDTRELAPRG